MKYNKRRKSYSPYKSKFEKDFAAALKKSKRKAKYEPDKFTFVRSTHYTPDWKIQDGVYIETKGYLSTENRTNLLLFREQHPHITICIVFQNSSNKLSKHSKTTYAEWATKHGIPWWDIRQGLPHHWWSY